jgi:hypothetical protein
MLEGPGQGDSDDSLPPSGGRPSSGGAAGILATLVPTGFRQPHMIESMAQGGPSHASGQVQPGDLLLEVDGADVRALSLKDIQAKIIGRSGTRVTLTLQRGKHNFPHKVTLTRSVHPLCAARGGLKLTCAFCRAAATLSHLPKITGLQRASLRCAAQVLPTLPPRRPAGSAGKRV